MKHIIAMCIWVMAAFTVNAQVTRVSLQASGLTCSMCSKAVLNALKEVPSVDKIQVDIKNQQYNITLKNETADLDQLSRAVEDAGFSVASLVVTARFDNKKLGKDEHLKIGNEFFHFLNADGRQLNGEASFTLVDKNFTSPKLHKKYAAMSKMNCVKTGRMASCCFSDAEEEKRIYHVII